MTLVPTATAKALHNQASEKCGGVSATDLAPRTIPLTRGLVALVDAEDYERLARHRWHAEEPKPGVYYAARREGATLIYMHRETLGLDVTVVDHRNGNGLDNRRANLRLATVSLNNCNARKRATARAPFKGVDWHRGAWRVRITPPGGRQITLGHFVDVLEAALVYDAAARRLFGPFARVNLPYAGEEAA
jgi:hypothetical protein